MATLVIKNDGIGDLILASGVIASLAEKAGPVDLVTCSQNREIAEMIPGLRRIIYTSRDGIRLRYKPLMLGLVWPVVPAEDAEAIREIRREEYDAAICLRRYIRTSSFVLMNRARARRRLGCWMFATNLPNWAAKHLSRNWENVAGSPVGSEISYYSDFLARSMSLEIAENPRLAIASDSTSHQAASTRKIGLSMGGAIDRWPASNWTELVSELHARSFGFPVPARFETRRHPKSKARRAGHRA